MPALVDDNDVQLVARVAHTFRLNPVTLLNELSPVQLAVLVAAHNVVAGDQRAANEANAQAMERARLAQQQRR